MDIWELLDIPPTTDIVRIKSAYAKQAKLYHPEEHPEKFKALQNAYKIAVRMTKNQNATTHITPANILKRELETEPSADIIERDMEEEKQKDAPKHNIEHFFDFSDVDSYGDRERFFEQFLLIADNPYLCNNLDAWEYFLDRKEFAELFVDTDFRIKLVHIMCDRFGWRRKTILYFERYLKKFHTEENKPIGGIWETELVCFRVRKLPCPELPALCTDRFFGKEGIAFHKKLRSQISRSQGREISLEIKNDLIRYMKLYLSCEESKVDFMERLHRDWVIGKVVLNSIAFVICLFAIWAWLT